MTGSYLKYRQSRAQNDKCVKSVGGKRPESGSVLPCRSLSAWSADLWAIFPYACKLRRLFSRKNYKIFREIRAPWLIITSSSYFHKVRALRRTSVLSRYHARSLRHQYECNLRYITSKQKKKEKICRLSSTLPSFALMQVARSLFSI